MFHIHPTKDRRDMSGNPTNGMSQTAANGSARNEEQNPAVAARMSEIEAQRQALLQKNPDFDMKAEMQNPDFVNYVWGSNLSVEDAYYLVHREELLEQARLEGMQMALKRSNRVPENGTLKSRPAIAKKSPKDLSDKEVDAIIARAKNGETITF